ncbi:hypothetical protein MBLNU459_g7246t2 [Dothideomycetes sp. NU459]
MASASTSASHAIEAETPQSVPSSPSVAPSMEADSNYDEETDSNFADDWASDTTSLKSEVWNHVYENGRRYHSYRQGRYHFPNDEKESNRMDIEHHNQGLQLGGKLHLAPLDHPQEIIDLGTGTGIWCIDMGEQYPSARITGMDLSPIQPEWVPPNVIFEIDDYEADWLYGSNHFDLVHWRFLMSSVADYPRLLRQIYDSLKPGGYIEFKDMVTNVFCDDDTFPETSASVQWSTLLNGACEKIGRPIPRLHEYKEMLEAAGFVDVREQYIKRPTNDWPKDPLQKEIGRFTWLNYMEGLEAFTLGPFTRVLGWSVQEVQILIAKIRNEWANRSMHGYQKG